MTIQLSDDSPIKAMLDALQSSRAQSLFERVEELRGRIIRLAVLMLVFLCVGFYFSKEIINYMKEPLAAALPHQKNVLHFTGPLEVMLAYMKVSFLVAALMVTPYFFLQLWKYLGPALPPAQRKLVVPFFLSSLVLFGLGGAFGYYLMLPMGLKWLLWFGQTQATAVITVKEYVNLVTLMLLAFGATFQLPLILIVLERLGLIQEKTLTKNRGIVLVAILIVSAIASPSPDPISMLVMAAPLYVLCELGVLVIHWMKKGEKKLPVVASGGQGAEPPGPPV